MNAKVKIFMAHRLILRNSSKITLLKVSIRKTYRIKLRNSPYFYTDYLESIVNSTFYLECNLLTFLPKSL